ncbi:FAD/NAD(P)-binding domain-containing protein [Conidiobolus coronatus NRRL 28638]|uniref:FAD/NAD(P)-binding domain-containing protein n=1 Tax=Conidiobolus coronatus (strain ATCC 28846 / CBS 209.66 / NRRL 28638) TaxID=796925 RepID=A0A137NTP6_CONC2|nr:FAD/NAD(P)-binding domain-containing protein [Conidiobolus coronatus NRRL 28638]|eukprot:KXN66175.1 FAD/NAD(P)-binding domain-containing protein [Conidiobolus coronatus NRRL 28638]
MQLIYSILLTLASAKKCKPRSIYGAGFDDLNSFANANGINIKTITQSGEIDIKHYLPVCIVGAGISGLRVADKLMNKGHKVKLFEKEDRVGGKVNTFRKDGRVYNMGAAILTDYDVKTFEIIQKANISWSNMELQYNGEFEFNSGSHIALPYFDRDPETLASFEQYRQIRPRLNIEPGYLEASPELLVTTAEWLKKNNLLGLTKFATIFLTAQGYGSLKTTPALYFIHLMDNITDIRKPIYHIPTGIDAIPNYMANEKDIVLNADISKIDRHDWFSAIEYTANNDRLTEICSSVVLAFPPNSKSVKKLIPDLRREEKRILDEVRTAKYGSIASIVTDMPFTAMSAALPPTNPQYLGDGTPMIFLNHTNGAFVSYHWIEGEYDQASTKADADIFETKLKTVFPKLKPGQGSQPALHTKIWEFFPHVNVESLKSNFYKKFNNIQGRRGLYYATPLMTIELIESAINSADYLVEKFF